VSDKKPAPAPEKDAKAEGEAAPPKKGLPMKMIAIVAVIMVVQLVVVVGVMKALGPKKSHAEVPKEELKTEDDKKTQEILVVEEKFQNLQTGRVWIWDVSVFVQARARNAARVEELLEQRKAEISEEISRIISRAQHAQLKEPDRLTLNRQITAALTKIFDVDEKGEPLIERVLIPKCRGFPADF